MNKHLPIRSIIDPRQRAIFANICVRDINPLLTDREAMLSAIVIAAANAPIFAITEDEEPISIAVCSIDMPGYARRVRYLWTDPDRRGNATFAITKHLAASARHVGIAVRSERERRAARRCGFRYSRSVGGGEWACATTRRAFNMKFAHPTVTRDTIEQAMRHLGMLAGVQGA